MRFQSQDYSVYHHNLGHPRKNGAGLTKAAGFPYYRSVTEHVSVTHIPNVEVREMEKGLRVRSVEETSVLFATLKGPRRHIPLPTRGQTMT